MKKIFLLSLILFSTILSFGQAKKKVVKKKVVAKKVVTIKKNTETPKPVAKVKKTVENNKNELLFPEVMAEYPGGEDHLIQFLSRNIKYPAEALENGVEGRVVVNFKVCEDGQLCDLKVVKSLSKETDAESIRVIKKMQKWKPALLKGKPVASEFSLPISFILSE